MLIGPAWPREVTRLVVAGDPADSTAASMLQIRIRDIPAPCPADLRPATPARHPCGQQPRMCTTSATLRSLDADCGNSGPGNRSLHPDCSDGGGDKGGHEGRVEWWSGPRAGRLRAPALRPTGASASGGPRCGPDRTGSGRRPGARAAVHPARRDNRMSAPVEPVRPTHRGVHRRWPSSP